MKLILLQILLLKVTQIQSFLLISVMMLLSFLPLSMFKWLYIMIIANETNTIINITTQSNTIQSFLQN